MALSRPLIDADQIGIFSVVSTIRNILGPKVQESWQSFTSVSVVAGGPAIADGIVRPARDSLRASRVGQEGGRGTKGNRIQSEARHFTYHFTPSHLVQQILQFLRTQ